MAASKKIKTIGIAFNLKKKGASFDEDEEYDEIETIDSIRQELEKLGFKVLLFEQGKDFAEKISAKRPDFVLNIAEGIGSSRARESQVPCVLESLGLPYSGSDPISIGITLDKYYTGLFLRSSRIPVPAMYKADDEKSISSLKKLFDGKKRYIVKPRWEGSSKGIFLHSVVKNYKCLEKTAREVIKRYKQPALVEEFLEGEEITAAVCGNSSARVLGMMKISPTDVAEKDFLYSIETKREWRKKVKYEPETKVRAKASAAVRKYAVEAYKALELRDIARIDFRLDSRGVPKIIDINPLPGLSPVYSDLPILYRLKGGTYPELVRVILHESFKRHGFCCKFQDK
jgi:D-alanine-D-alanine ligase